MTVSKRKQEHIDISLNEDIRFRRKTTGFEQYDWIHCALPEMDFDEVDPSTVFLNKKISFPLMVSPMTGGFDGAMEINRDLAEICQDLSLPLAVGSQRQILENDQHRKSFQIVRKTAPDIAIIGNVGAAQIAHIRDISPIQHMADLIQADALAVHLNPLQELLQPEGNTDFSGVLDGIATLVQKLSVPVIAKEIGCGISREAASKLKEAGVKIIDIAGAGGTSWAGIETFRNDQKMLGEKFWDWGIPTSEALAGIAQIDGITRIASGGIGDGMTIAKALALGADLCGSALPILKAWTENKSAGVRALLQTWKQELKMVLFLTGCKDIPALQHKNPLVHRCQTMG